MGYSQGREEESSPRAPKNHRCKPYDKFVVLLAFQQNVRASGEHYYIQNGDILLQTSSIQCLLLFLQDCGANLCWCRLFDKVTYTC